MDVNVVTTDTLEDKEQVALKLSNYDYLALPVIDKEGCLVGIVTVDDAVDVLQEEATEDIQKMAAILPTETPYLKQSIWTIWKGRVFWLVLLLVSSTFTSLTLSSYESNLDVVFAAFVPMLMGTAGNAGGQASVTVIRAIALNEVDFRDTLKVIWKEVRASFFIGLTVAIVCFAKLMLIDRLYDESITVSVSLIISAVVLLSIVMAKIIGCILPLIAKKCKLDPAVVASPFMTTIVDTLSLILYCSIAIAIVV